MSTDLKKKTDEVSFLDLFKLIKLFFVFIKSNLWILTVSLLIGAAVGFLYTKFKATNYLAKISFVVEESGNRMGGVSSLAGQFGLDFGVGGSGGSVISGDNILLFLKSESLCKQALSTMGDSNTSYSLFDRYTEVYGLRNKWVKKFGEQIFPLNSFKSNKNRRLQDSLMSVISTRIITQHLNVYRPDKKAAFVIIEVLTQDEFLSKSIAKNLLNVATERYVSSKNKFALLNVKELESKADSLSQILKGKTYQTASFQQDRLDANPAAINTNVNVEISNREKSIVATLYGEVVKNLEFSKSMLSQQTPVIQIVDESDYPLVRVRESSIKNSLVYAFAFFAITTIFLLIRNFVSAIQKSNTGSI